MNKLQLPKVHFGRFNLITLITAFEYFDFIGFSLFYPFIPFTKNHICLQFTVGYVGRFAGSILVSLIYPRLGNQKILLLSVWSMTICTLLIGFLPDHPSSFIFLYLLRTLQGLSFAIEFPVGSLLSAQKKEYGSTVQGATIGYLFATILFQLLTPFLRGWMVWRIPFLLGGLVGLNVAMQRTMDFKRSFDLEQPVLKFLFYLSIIWIVMLHFSYSNLVILLIILLLGFLLQFLYKRGIFTGLTKEFYLPKSKIVLSLFYFCSLFLSIRHSISQAKLVSLNPSLAGINLISLLIPLLCSRINPGLFQWISILLLTISTIYRSISISSFGIKLLLILLPLTTMVLPRFPLAQVIHVMLYLDCSRHTPILLSGSALTLTSFIFNQIIVTTFMLNAIKYASLIFQSSPYLSPIVYNGIGLLASVTLNYLTR